MRSGAHRERPSRDAYQFLMLTLAGWVDRSQQGVIKYSQEQNRVLRKQLGGRRLLFTDANDGFLNQ